MKIEQKSKKQVVAVKGAAKKTRGIGGDCIEAWKPARDEE